MQRCLNIAKISLSFIFPRDLWLSFQFSCVEINYLVRLGHSHVVHHGGCSGQNNDMEEFPTPGQVYNPSNTDAFVRPFSLNHITCMKVICFLHSQSSEACVINLFWCQLPPAYLVIHISSPTCFGGILFVPFVLWSHLCFVSWSWYREGQR